MRRCNFFFEFALIGVLQLVAQSVEIEKLGQFSEIQYKSRPTMTFGPYGIYVDEVNQQIKIVQGVDNQAFVLEQSNGYKSPLREPFTYQSAQRYDLLGNTILSSGYSFVHLQRTSGIKVDMSVYVTSGISFLLKNRDEYLCFFVNDKGLPGAADTTGRVYAPAEAMAFLKAYDPVKYEESLKRARQLGIETVFKNNQVLVWGQTYYSTLSILRSFWEKKTYRSSIDQVQYDLQGNGYQSVFVTKNPEAGSEIRILDSNVDRIVSIDVTSSSKILSTYDNDRNYSTSTYVGFGGNIYFYVAGDDFTEVFRIRRTWGEPDYYAMAINGYTDDSYGEYVKATLEKLSKEELRLLRNHLFALYGYVFKSEDLSLYFDKIVWYQAVSTATMDSIRLPSERQALFDLIVAEEEKR